jgi:hypothetical protein
VGEPIALKMIEDPTSEEVNKVYEEYYGSIRELFKRHKQEAGYADWELVLH